MLLGNTSWRIRRVESRSGRVLVEDAHGQPPTIPFWRGEAPARTFELSAQVAELAPAHQRSSRREDECTLEKKCRSRNEAGKNECRS